MYNIFLSNEFFQIIRKESKWYCEADLKLTEFDYIYYKT